MLKGILGGMCAMANGISDCFRFTNLEGKLGKLRELWIKYEYQEAILHIDQRISIERDIKKNAMFVHQHLESLFQL